MFSRKKMINSLIVLLIVVLLLIDGVTIGRSALGLSTPAQTPPGGPTATRTSPERSTAFVKSGSSPAAMPVGDMPGWHQIFADDFNGNALDTSKWYPYAGQPGGDPASWWAPSHIIVSGGVLVLKGYRDARAKPGVFVTAGVGMKSTYAQTYGKYLIRVRAERGNHVSVIALLWPESGVWPPEIDFFEDGGGNRTGTSAWWHCGWAGDNACQVHEGLSGYDFSQWHTIGVEWTAGKLMYTIDGRAWATITDPRVPSIPMVLDLQTEVDGCSNGPLVCPDSSTPAEVDMQVDWVVAYAPKQQ